METILLVTAEPAHRFLYENALKKHFRLVFAPPVIAIAIAEPVRAIVCDLSAPEEVAACFDWIESFKVPVVVLTPDPKLPLPRAERQMVLGYPVSPQQLLQALGSLGIAT